MRFFGTASTSPAVQLNFEQVGVVAASAAQVWTTSCFTKLVAGSLTDIAAVTLRLYPRTAVPAELPGVVSSDLKSEITAARARISAALTTPASTATVNTGLAFSITGTKTLDFTIRLYSPQLEAGAFATSPIITTGAAGTRGADAPRLTVVGGEKTVIVEGIAPTTLTATLRCLASLTTADFATYVVAGFTSTGTVQLFRKSSIGNTTLGVTSNVVTAGAPFKFALLLEQTARTHHASMVAHPSRTQALPEFTLLQNCDRAGGRAILVLSTPTTVASEFLIAA